MENLEDLENEWKKIKGKIAIKKEESINSKNIIMPIKRKKNYLDNKTELKSLFTKNKIKNRKLFFSTKFPKGNLSSTLDEKEEKNLSEDFQIFDKKKKKK